MHNLQAGCFFALSILISACATVPRPESLIGTWSTGSLADGTLNEETYFADGSYCGLRQVEGTDAAGLRYTAGTWSLDGSSLDVSLLRSNDPIYEKFVGSVQLRVVVSVSRNELKHGAQTTHSGIISTVYFRSTHSTASCPSE